MVYVDSAHCLILSINPLQAAPAADFERLVLASRIVTATFLTDDVIDSGRMLDRIAGFKQATGNGVCAFHFVRQVD